ncbi:DedA family protein [Candidatus Woesearchaeota archaeon]|nr:DedA family protein [Candidatus Woesearchaeota archaeon]
MLQYVTNLMIDYGILGIIISTFLSFSVLPLPSDAAILLAANYFDPYTLLFASLIGSSLGSIVNYYIGLKGIRVFFIKKPSRKQKKAEAIFDRWGGLSLLLLSWLPFIGDPLIVIAGTLRMKFWKFLFYSTLGKLWYFIVLIWFGSLFAF